MQFLAWVLQMPAPGRSGGKNYFHAGDAYLYKRQNYAADKMYPMEHKTPSPPTIIKKMKTFLEVEGKMGPIPPPSSSQHRPSQPGTNPNVRKDNATEKRKRAVPTKRFRSSTAPSLVRQPCNHP